MLSLVKIYYGFAYGTFISSNKILNYLISPKRDTFLFVIYFFSLCSFISIFDKNEKIINIKHTHTHRYAHIHRKKKEISKELRKFKRDIDISLCMKSYQEKLHSKRQKVMLLNKQQQKL